MKNDYTDQADQITQDWHDAKAAGSLAELPADLKPYEAQIVELIDSVFNEGKLPKVEDGRKPKTNPLNANFEKKAFQDLWALINQKAVYRVEFDTDELIAKCKNALEAQLRVTPLQYTIQIGLQTQSMTDTQLQSGRGFDVTETRTESGQSVHSRVKYDLLGKLAEETKLKRQTVAAVLTAVESAVFGQFKQNPEHFIAEAARLINEQKAAVIIERLSYNTVSDRYESDIFTANQIGQDFSRTTKKLKNHVYDYVIADSDVERNFVGELDTSNEVVVYAKLPRGFLIPTPVGDYNPDWAITFKQGAVKHIYFVAETKGSMSTLQLREIEKTKIECARKFFSALNKTVEARDVRYDVVTDYGKLMEIVGRAA